MRYLLILLLSSLPLMAKAEPKLALIIDDLGYNHHDQVVLSLPRAVTLSILPHTPFGAALAARARQPVMLHLPMQPEGHPALEKGTLTEQQSPAQMQHILDSALADIPEARGVNNHMGSRLTQDRQRMNWLMTQLAQRHLYFVDSRTTAHSQAMAAAIAAAVPAVERQVFLDNTPASLPKQWHRALRLARQHGQVVVIAHPHPYTLRFLQKALTQLKGIELVPVTALLPGQQLARSGKMAAPRG